MVSECCKAHAWGRQNDEGEIYYICGVCMEPCRLTDAYPRPTGVPPQPKEVSARQA